MRAKRTCVALGVALGVGAAACQLVAPLNGTPFYEVPVVPAPIGTADPCDDRTLVRRPNVDDGGSRSLDAGTIGVDAADGADEQTMALAYLELDPSVDPTSDSKSNDRGFEVCRNVGFDLDHKATCFPDGGTEAATATCAGDPLACAWGPSCLNPWAKDSCDAVNGVDNAIGRVLNTVTLEAAGINVEQVLPGKVIRAGTNNVVLRLVGYNGTLEDDDVTLFVYSSTGLATSEALLPEAGAPKEVWDQRSRRSWYLDPESVTTPGKQVAKLTGQGFVTNGVLVATLSGFPLPLGAAAITIPRVRLVGELRLAGGAWGLVRGRLGGTIARDDLLTSVLSLTVYRDNQPSSLCTDDVVQALTTLGCNFSDLAAGDETVCSSLSFGAAFVAVPAVLGEPRPRLARTGVCTPDLRCK